MREGPQSLGDHDLLALVLGHGTAGRPAHDVAGALLAEVGGLHGLTRVSAARLTRAAGVGVAQAARVIAAIELGRRTLAVAPRARLPLRTPREFGQLLLPRYGAHPTEQFGVVLLDARHRLIRIHVVSNGGLDAAVALPREVFREATISGAAAIAVFHNHPSGDPTPTRADIDLTRRLADAGTIMGIDMLDHLILADTLCYSMRRAEQF